MRLVDVSLHSAAKQKDMHFWNMFFGLSYKIYFLCFNAREHTVQIWLVFPILLEGPSKTSIVRLIRLDIYDEIYIKYEPLTVKRNLGDILIFV